MPAYSLADGEPIAVITPLPDYVSNGSEYALDGTDSYDTTSGGFIKDWYWEITFNETVETSHASLYTYTFKELGLYKINLTVTDNQNLTNRSFTAVVSILDKDGDQMSDWWEIDYFHSMNYSGSDDYDGDGYTNFVEFAKQTDPTVIDPTPKNPSFVDQMSSHWYVFVLAAAVVIGIVLSIYPFLRQRRMKHEKKKIEAAIAIEKELEREERE